MAKLQTESQVLEAVDTIVREVVAARAPEGESKSAVPAAPGAA